MHARTHAPGNAGEAATSISVPVLHGTTPVTTSLPSLLVCAEAVQHAAVATATTARRRMGALLVAAIGGTGRSLRYGRHCVRWCMYCSSFDLLCHELEYTRDQRAVVYIDWSRPGVVGDACCFHVVQVNPAVQYSSTAQGATAGELSTVWLCCRIRCAFWNGSRRPRGGEVPLHHSNRREKCFNSAKRDFSS